MPVSKIFSAHSKILFALFALSLLGGLALATGAFSNEKGCQKCYREVVKKSGASSYWPLGKTLRPAIGKRAIDGNKSRVFFSKKKSPVGRGGLVLGRGPNKLLIPRGRYQRIALWVNPRSSGTVFSQSGKKNYWSLDYKRGRFLVRSQQGDKAYLCQSRAKASIKQWHFVSVRFARKSAVFLGKKKILSCDFNLDQSAPLRLGSFVEISTERAVGQQELNEKELGAEQPKSKDSDSSVRAGGNTPEGSLLNDRRIQNGSGDDQNANAKESSFGDFAESDREDANIIQKNIIGENSILESVSKENPAANAPEENPKSGDDGQGSSAAVTPDKSASKEIGAFSFAPKHSSQNKSKTKIIFSNNLEARVAGLSVWEKDNRLWKELDAAVTSGTVVSSRSMVFAQGANSLWGWGSGSIAMGTAWPPGSSPGGRYYQTSEALPSVLSEQNNWDQVSVGDEFVLAIRDGQLYSWGFNDKGQLGQGYQTYSANLAQVRPDLTWSMVSAGTEHSLGITTDGKLWSWGESSNQRLGLGGAFASDQNSPQQVGSATNWQDISAGDRHSLGIAGGRLYVWGEGGSYRTGRGSILDRSSPTQIGTDTDWQDISAGSTHSLAVKGGQLWVAGSNANGKTGRNTASGTTNSWIAADTDTNWSQVSAGPEHSLGIKGGKLWAWGDATTRAAINSATDTLAPTQITEGASGSISSLNWQDVAAGSTSPNYAFSLALSSGGEIYSWGSNNNGQTGLGVSGSNTITVAPTAIGDSPSASTSYPTSSWTAISAGARNGFALSSSAVSLPSNNTPPTVSGTAAIDSTLTSTPGSWDEGFPMAQSTSYQWQSCNADGSDCQDISGATGSSYTVQSGDYGERIRLKVTLSNDIGSASAFSSKSSAVPALPPTNTVPPTITGTTSVGSELSASAGSWQGSPASYAYQWQRCEENGTGCVDIGGATATTYTLVSADAGKRLQVRVTATNSAGSAAATSAQTAAISQIPVNSALPEIAGTESVGNTLTGSVGTWTGYPEPTYTYQWQRCDSAGQNCADISGATTAAYLLIEDDSNKKIQLRITATNSAGSVSATSLQTSLIASVPANTVLPEITGAASLGSELSASAGTWQGNPTSYTYQWQRCEENGTGCVDIGGATATTYTLVSADVGKRIRIRVTATNSFGPSSADSLQTDPVARSPQNTTPPLISGTAAVGSSLSVSDGTWIGFPSPTYTYQWQRCNTDGTGCVDISDATASSYTLVAADASKRIQAIVTASNLQGSATVTAAQVGPVVQSPVNDTLPQITGTAAVSSQLSATPGSWSGYPAPTYAYQWQRCETNGTGCQDISGATFADYVLQPEDASKRIQVRVTATNSTGSTSATSAQTSAVVVGPANTSLPGITGTATFGATLQADPGSWSGYPAPTYAYQWQRCETNGTGCTNIQGATFSSYQLGEDDVSKRLQVLVTATNSQGSATETSAQTAAVTQAPSIGAPTINGEARVGVELSSLITVGAGFPEPTLSYQWQVSDNGTSGWTNISGATGSTYTLQSAEAGRYIRLQVTATNSAGTDVTSSLATDVVAAAPVNTTLPRITGTASTTQRLVATDGAWSGYPEPSLSRQWQACQTASGDDCSPISGATGITYVPSGSQLGKFIRLQVTATNASGSASAFSARTSTLTQPTPGSLDASFLEDSSDTFNGDVYDLAVGANDKTIAVGAFTAYNGISRNYVARLMADGSLDASFDPGSGPNGQVQSVALQTDGKILLGGDFTSYDGTARNGIARLNADGSLDTSFDPGSGAPSVYAISLQTDGKILLGGDFTSYDGTARNGIARLNVDGSLDTSFDPGSGADSSVYEVSLQSDGKIILGGAFTTYDGTARNRIARVNANGSLDTSFDPGSGADSSVLSMDLQSDGKVILGGSFSSYNGVSRSRIARVNANGSLDTSFDPGSGAFGSLLTAVTSYSVAIQGDGKILLGGSFRSYNDAPRNNITRVNADGSLDSSFDPGSGVNGAVYDLALQSDGKVLLGGDFTGTARNRIARLNTDGSLDGAAFAYFGGANNQIFAAALQADGKILLGGDFTSYNGTTRNYIARVNANGSLDTSFDPGSGASSSVYDLALQSDGKVILGGAFTTYNGVSRSRIARVNSDGSLDTSFDPGSGTSSDISSLVLQPDGKILISGFFTSYDGTARNYIARLNSDGSLDTSFNPGSGANGAVYDLALQSDGKIILGGSFSSYNGTARNRIARVNANGSLDTSFDPGSGASSNVFDLALQSDGKVLLGGSFTSYNGTARNRIARLNTNGSLDTSFDPGSGANTDLYAVSEQTDGKILLGGQFTSYNGIDINRIARLNSDGSLDTSFDPGSGANNGVRFFLPRADGQIYTGGNFTYFDGLPRGRFALLNGDAPADTTPPDAPTITEAPDNNIAQNVASVAFTGEAGASFRCAIQGSGDPLPTYEGASSCTSPRSFTNLGNGLYTIYLWQADLAGNVSEPATAVFTVDLNEPEADPITCEPVNQSDVGEDGWFLGDVSCSTDATAAVAEITEVEFEVSTDASCTSWQTSSGSLQGSGSQRRAVKNVDATGQRCIRARAINAAGTASPLTASQPIKIDRDTPQITETSTPPSSPTSGQVLFTSPTISDATSKPGRIRIQYRSAASSSEEDWADLPGAACANQPLSGENSSAEGAPCVFNTAATVNNEPVLPDGEYQLRLVAEDKAGRTVTEELDAKPGRTGKTLIVRNSISASLPTSLPSGGNYAPSAPANGTSGSSVTIQMPSRNVNVLAGGAWELRSCVPAEAPAERMRSAGGETFPDPARLQALDEGAPEVFSLSKTCGSTARMTTPSRQPTDDAASVQFKLLQDLPWSVSPGEYSLPISFVASQEINTVAGAAAVAQTMPSISGTLSVGETLSTTNGEWYNSPTSYSYQWQRCDSASGGSCIPVGNDSSSYTLVAADAGQYIQVQVTAANGAGSESALSSRTDAIGQTPANSVLPEITGQAAVGEALSATSGTWSGTPAPTYTYQWQRCDSAAGEDCSDISGSTTATHTLVSADENKYIRVRVTATNTAGSASANSARTSQVAARGAFVAVSNDGTNRVMTSPDGITWTAHQTAVANNWWGVTYGNGTFVAISGDGSNEIMTSTDEGVTWSTRSSPEANQWFSVTHGDGQFVAVSQNGTNRVMTSPDGINWTARQASEANSWRIVTHGNGLFVAVSVNGTSRVMTSPDGINWTARQAAEANQWFSVTYGNGLFVAVALDGTNRVMTSPDGINWTARQAAEANQWRSVTYGNGQFVAVSQTGTNRVMTSPDGINWTARQAPEANSWQSVTYGNGTFVAVAGSGTNRVMTSTDGINWTAHSAAEANFWRSVTYGE